MTSSIANETVDHSKNREPFSFYKFITNKYFLNVVSIVLFLALWDYVAKEKIFRDSLARPLEVVDQLYRLKKKYGATVEDMLTYLDNCRRELDDIAYVGDALERLEKDCAKAEKAARKAAAELSAAPDYFPVAAAAIQEMFRQTGPYVIENGLPRRGVVIRHLVLPGYPDNSRRVMDWVARTFQPGDVLFSLMSQYTPDFAVDAPQKSLH